MTNTTTSTPRPVYPLSQADHTGPRLTYGLLFDTADALIRNGFPRPAGTDWADLSLDLDHFLYQETP